ncbi:hypothetical protein KZZ08_00655 [Roseovarius mucosus]|uniref:hypothetical protein n=1 Tax=Roseovarius mucosus TaxID=215743 RepID=UPI001C607CCF|nr:hypothetical protein [Roseovarius mucosus]MBW4972106.1 hypothetical protein [Roseovarius mucosus]
MSTTTGIIVIALLCMLALSIAGLFLLLRLTDEMFDELGGGKRERFPDCQDDFHAAMQRQIAREKGMEQ